MRRAGKSDGGWLLPLVLLFACARGVGGDVDPVLTGGGGAAVGGTGGVSTNVGGKATGATSSGGSGAGGESSTVGAGGSAANTGGGATGSAVGGAGSGSGGGTTVTPTDIWINEIHYDNASTDMDEGVEISGPAGTDLNGWALVAYNGKSTVLAPYDTLVLSGFITDQQNGRGTLWFSFVPLQNGSPDGLALVDPGLTVVQFLSYEGTFQAQAGIAAGLISTDIGVSESSSTPVGSSLQLQGNGQTYGSFVWSSTAIARTAGAVNTGQTF